MRCCCPQRPATEESRPADSDAFENGEEVSVKKMPYENKFGVRVTKNAPTYRHARDSTLVAHISHLYRALVTGKDLEVCTCEFMARCGLHPT